MTDYRYPADLIAKTESRIKAQLEGNGQDVNKTQLNVVRQGIGVISGRTGYSLSVKTNQQNKAGRATNGTVVGEGQLQNEVAAYVQKIQSEQSFENIILENIKSLPIKGFGADKTVIPLHHAKAIYIEHRSCGTCHGQKQITCATCGGKGRSQCQKCSGTGTMNCMLCFGQGQIQVGDQRQQCHECHGRGQIYCNMCNGQQQIQCPNCQAKGYIICKTCNGEGASSQIVEVIPEAVTKAEIYIHDLDPEPKRMVSLVTPEKLAAGGHIICETVKPPQKDEVERAYYEDAPKAEKQSVFYEAEFPWAVAEMTLNDKAYKIYLAGKKGAICESDGFMDVVLEKPLGLLHDAGHHAANVASRLEEACQYRFSRETLSAVIKGHKKKAAMTLHQSYGVGLGKKTIMNAVNNAYLAMKRVTRKPRYLGLGFGLIIAASLYTGWFVNDWRNITATQHIAICYLVDFIIYLIGAGLTLAIIKLNGVRVLKSVFDRVNIPVTFKTMPAAGTAGLYAWGGCLLMWGGLLSLQIIM